MRDKHILVALVLVLFIPFLVSYSPELAVRKEIFFKRSPVSAFTSEIKKVCCSDPERSPMYMVENSVFTSVITLEKSIFGNWNVPNFSRN